MSSLRHVLGNRVGHVAILVRRLIVSVAHHFSPVLIVELALLTLALKLFELLCLVLLRLAIVFQDYYQLSQAFNIFRMLLYDVFVLSERLWEVTHSPIA